MFHLFTAMMGGKAAGRKRKASKATDADGGMATLIHLQQQTVDSLNKIVAIQHHRANVEEQRLAAELRRASVEEKRLAVEEKRLEVAEKKYRLKHLLSGLDASQPANNDS